MNQNTATVHHVMKKEVEETIDNLKHDLDQLLDAACSGKCDLKNSRLALRKIKSRCENLRICLDTVTAARQFEEVEQDG